MSLKLPICVKWDMKPYLSQAQMWTKYFLPVHHSIGKLA